MRNISAAVVAALFAIVSFGVSAATVGVPAVKTESTFALIKKGAKTYKKATKAKTVKAKAKKGGKKAGKKASGKKAGGRPGRCGVGKYYAKGKCASASDKK